MQNLMTICPPIPTNNTKQYDSTKSPLALLAETCRNIGADTSSKSSFSIDHTKKDLHNVQLNTNKLHSNNYLSKPNSSSANQLNSLSNNCEAGRRSGNSSSEYARASISPANSLDKNNALFSTTNPQTSSSSRPSSNNGNSSRPNSNNSGNSSLASSKTKEVSKLSFKPYENNSEKKESNNQSSKRSPDNLDVLKNLSSKNDRKSTDSSRSNGLSPKNSANCCLPNAKNTTNSLSLPTNSLSYAAQQQQLLDSKYLQYQQYLAAIASGYSNNPLSVAATNPMLHNLSASTNAAALAAAAAAHQQSSSLHQSNRIPNSNPALPANIAASLGVPNCPPGCNSCIHHNPLLNSAFAASATQSPSSVHTNNNMNNIHLLANAHQIAAMSAQYPQMHPHLLSLYMAGYPSSLNNLNSSSSINPNLNSNPAIQHQSNQNLNSSGLPNNTSSTSINTSHSSAHHNSSSNNNAVHNSTNNTSKSATHVCNYTGINGSFCGKRFTSIEEYYIHSKIHPMSDFSGINPAAFDSLYGSYEALLANNSAIANLKRSAMQESLNNSRFHPYSKPNNYTQNSASSIIPSALGSAPSSLPFPPTLNNSLGLNGINNLVPTSNASSNSQAAAAAAAVAAVGAFNMWAPYASGRVGPPVQQ